MPELPEVETVVRTLRPLLVGATIRHIDVRHPKMLHPNAKTFVNTVQNLSFTSIERIGKFILFFLTEKIVFVSHLRMEGKFLVLEKEDLPLTRYARMIFTLKDGRRLIYDDMRKFGTMTLSTLDRYRQLPALKNLGQEPETVYDPSSIHQSFHLSKRPLKSLLLDQTILLGLGNIYADEVLFASNIHPLTQGRQLTLVQTKMIIQKSQQILKAAIADGGTRIRSYASGAAIDGKFNLRIHVYGRDQQPCHTCGHRLDKITIGGRGSHYCPRCQHHPEFPYVIGITGEIATGKSTLLSVGKSLGFATLSADDLVSDIYRSPKGKKTLKKLFPESFQGQTLQRHLLLKTVVDQPRRYLQLIRWLFPLVKETIYQRLVKMKQTPVILEVPLLFQGKVDAYCDTIIGLDMPKHLQQNLLTQRQPESAHLLSVLNERNQYRDFLLFVDTRLRNDADIETFKNRIKQVLKPFIVASSPVGK
jgi:formamidopyrimidine-DNA glycosylase